MAISGRSLRLLTTAMLLALPASGRAMTLAGVTMPDTMQVAGAALRLNGAGVRSFTMLQVHGYVAGLYLTQPAHTADAILSMPGPKVLRIVFVRSAGVGRVRDEFRDSQRRNCAAGCPAADAAPSAQLLEPARRGPAGDVATYVYLTSGIQVLFNGAPVATIASADFSRRMLRGMIGAYPPTEAMRDGLLGLDRATATPHA